MKITNRMSSDQAIAKLASNKTSKEDQKLLTDLLSKRGIQIKYKLTTQGLTTHNGFQWAKGEPKETSGKNGLCSDGWLHYYHNPLLAMLLNPTHADISNPKLWIAKCEGKHLDDHGLKGGCTKMTLVKELEMPTVTREQRIAFGILCAMEGQKDKAFQTWAKAWLDGSDRTEESATNAFVYADRAAEYAANAAANAADIAAEYAANAAAATIDLIAIANEAMKY